MSSCPHTLHLQQCWIVGFHWPAPTKFNSEPSVTGSTKFSIWLQGDPVSHPSKGKVKIQISLQSFSLSKRKRLACQSALE